MSSDSLILRHRPEDFKDVIGHRAVLPSYKRAIDDKTSHAFLFTGPPGVGKTTLARLGAQRAAGKNGRVRITEIDAATNNSVEDVRNLTEALQYRELGGMLKAIIMDECHVLSAQAWKPLLKSVEEPPEWVRWFFCTTDPKKVPETIVTRCAVYELQEVAMSDIRDHLDTVCKDEGFDTPSDILALCARQARGSVRKALSLLSVCYGAKDRQEAARLVAQEEEGEEGEAFKLARALAEDAGWDKIQKLLQAMKATDNFNPEGARRVVQQYFSTVMLNAKDEKVARTATRFLDIFSEPFDSGSGLAPLLLAIGRCKFAK